MTTIKVNGQVIEVPDGESVSVDSRGGTLTVNGSVIGTAGGFAGRTAKIEVVGGVVGSVNADGSVTCGNVGGGVQAGSSVNCGNVTGDVRAGSSVHCGQVGGGVQAGSSVNMRR